MPLAPIRQSGWEVITYNVVGRETEKVLHICSHIANNAVKLKYIPICILWSLSTNM